MYEKNADIMSSLAGAKDTVSKGALSLLAKLKGTSQNDIDNSVRSQLPPDIASGIDSVRNTVQSQLPSDVSKIVDDLRNQNGGQLADKATKLLGEGGRKFEDKAPSALSYIPGIGGYLGGLSKPTPGRGRFVSALGEGVSGNLGGMLGGASGAFGGAALGGIGALLAKVLSKGRINLGREAILGAALPGGVVGNSLGTHAGAGLFHDMAAKSAEHKDSAASGLAYVPGVGGSLDGFFNPIPGRGRLVSAMGEGQMASRFGASSGLLGGMGGATVGTAGALLALLLSKGKLNPRASLALGLGGPLGGAVAGGLVGNSIGTHAGANLFREMAAKEAEHTEGHKGGIMQGVKGSIGGGLLGGIGGGVTSAAMQALVNILTKGKVKFSPAHLAAVQRDAIGLGAASGAYGGYTGYTNTDPIKDMVLGRPAKKAADWSTAPSFSANMPLLEKKPNPFVSGKKPLAKADASGAEAALAKLASQDNCYPSRSAAGDSKGVKYKQQTEDHATGTAAFDSLDKYLRMAKKAGLNDFQSNFFGRLIQEGINENEMYEAIKQAGDQFGYKVGKELNRGLEKLSNWGALGKGLMTGAKYLGAGALGAGAGVAASGAVQKGVQDGVQQGVKDGVQQGVQNVGNNAINSASNFMGNMANSASNFMGNAMGNSQQNGDTMHRVRSNIPESAGNPYHAVRSNIPEPAGNPLQNMASTAMQHFGNMANGAMGMMGTGMRGGAAANGAGQQNSGFNPLQYMPGAGGAFGGAHKVNGLGGGFTGNGMGKQSREKQAVNWAGMANAAAKYLGTGLARPGAAVKKVYDAAKSVGSAGPSMPSISNGIKGVLNDKTMRSQMWTGAGTGATNPFTGAFTPSDDPNAGWGDYAARVGGSALAGAGAGLLGGKGVQDVMKRMYAGSLAGSTADLGGTILGYDTGGLGGKAGFLGAGVLPAKMPKFLGAKANRFAGGYDPVDMGMGFTMPGRQGDTVTALNKLDPFSLIGKGYNLVKPNVRPTFDKAMSGIKNNPGIATGAGLGVAGIGTGAYIGNKAVSGINDASERMNAQMNMLRNETHNNLSGIRQDMSGGMGGIGQFFEENKHWLMPALLAGGGALAGGALGGQSGAAMGGLSLPALYMMHQNGMFGGGGGAAANPLQAPPAKANYIQRQQQHEQELIDDYIARRNQDPRLASPTAQPSKPYMGTGVTPNFPPKPKTAGDRAVRLMRHFAKN